MSRAKLVLSSLALAVAAVGLLSGTVQAAGDNTAQGSITLNFENREGQPRPESPPVDPGLVLDYTPPPLLPLKTSMMLSDPENTGTFAMQFDIYEREQAVFDSFRVTNTGNLPFAFVLADENQTLEPARQPDFSDLGVCFNELCSLGIFVPDTLFLPPVPLSALLPQNSQTFTVGVKLFDKAQWSEWDGLTVRSTTDLKAVPAL